MSGVTWISAKTVLPYCLTLDFVEHTLLVIHIKQYDSTRIGAIVVLAAKNAASKNHFKDILCDKNCLYGIIVHLTSNVVFKTRKHFWVAGY